MGKKIEDAEIKRALVSRGYAPGKVIWIDSNETLNEWNCIYMLPLQAIERLAEITPIDVSQVPDPRWADLIETIPEGCTVIVKRWQRNRHFAITVEGFDTENLRGVRAGIAPS